MLPVRYLLMLPLSIRASFPNASLLAAIVPVIFSIGSRIVLKLLLGASLERLCAVGSSRLILTLSARYPALESSSSGAPGIALTCI